MFVLDLLISIVIVCMLISQNFVITMTKSQLESNYVKRRLNVLSHFSKLKVQHKVIHDIDTFDKYHSVDELKSIKVYGNTSCITSHHPVIKAVLNRFKTNSKPGNRHARDINRIALSIEGGGMRGAVSAGASAALTYLGLNDAIDIVYGSSAG